MGPTWFTPTKRKVFVSYHHGGDQVYYDAFARRFADNYDVIADNSLDRRIDSEDVEYVMRRIGNDYVSGSSCTIVLVGARTWARKYVDWEIKATLDREHGLIGVRLPSLFPNANGKYPVPERLFDNIQAGYAIWTTWDAITSSPQACTSLIEQANRMNKQLITNSRDRRLRNAS